MSVALCRGLPAGSRTSARDAEDESRAADICGTCVDACLVARGARAYLALAFSVGTRGRVNIRECRFRSERVKSSKRTRSLGTSFFVESRSPRPGPRTRAERRRQVWETRPARRCKTTTLNWFRCAAPAAWRPCAPCAPIHVPHCAWQCIEELRGKREELNTSIATDEEEKGVATFRAGAASLWPSSSP